MYCNRTANVALGCSSDFSQYAPKFAASNGDFTPAMQGEIILAEPYCTAGVHLADGLKSIISTDCCTIGQEV